MIDARDILDPYELWMVKSNLETIQAGTWEHQVALLRSNGYFRIAAAVEQEAKKLYLGENHAR